jgi:hypothetical protein
MWIRMSVLDLPFAGGLAALLVVAAWPVARAPFAVLYAVLVGTAAFVWGGDTDPGQPGETRLLPRFGAFMGLAIIRHAAYATGMAWGMLTGWRKRSVTLRPMVARLRRYQMEWQKAPRLVEQHVFNIGSWSKEVPARA